MERKKNTGLHSGTLIFSSERFTDLGKLNLLMVVRF